MRHDAAADRRAQVERMALRLAFDVDALEQRGLDASPQDLAAVVAAAEELRRASLALAFAFGDDDPTVVFAQTVLEGFDHESGRLAAGARDAGDVFAEAVRDWRPALRRDLPAAAEHERNTPAAWAIAGSYL